MLLTRTGSTLVVPGLTELSWFPFLDPMMRLEKYRQDDKFNGILEITMIVGEPEHAVRSIPITVPNGQPKQAKKS